ncbi:MAG: ATP-binding protein [Pseudomonadota bacterium]
MAARNEHTDRADELRQRAEQQEHSTARSRSPAAAAESPEQAAALLHELRVHQIELELQNEELRQAQVELEASRARYFDLFDLAPVGYLSLSDTGTILEANLTAAGLLGVARGELVHRMTTHFVLPADQDIFYRYRKALFDSGDPQVCELRLLRRDGEPFWARLDATLVQDTEGGPRCRVAFADISELRSMQARLAQSDRLVSMGLLAAGVAHEINNPLAYVLYNTESLAEDIPKLARVTRRCCEALRQAVGEAAHAELVGPEASLLDSAQLEDAADRARQAFEGTQRITAISRSLGSFSRVERAELGPVELRQAIASASIMAHNEIKFRAQLVLDHAQVPPVWASEGKLSQVFLNLLLNAAHAIDEGQVERNHIWVRTWAEAGQVCAEVRDSGSGISPDNLQRIFDPFFTTKGVGVGSGLGLAICQNIVDELGGDIRVESQLGHGTRVLLRLPPGRPAPLASPPRVDARPVPAAGPRGRILVVDDEAAIRDVVRHMLGREHELVFASSGREGRDLVERDQGFDLILCDLMMPDLTGMDLHAWLAQHHPTLARQVVFLTGGAFTPRAGDYLASVDNPRLAKPFDAAALRRLVGEGVVAARART